MTDERAGDLDVDRELTRLLRRQRARALKRAAEVDESLDFTSFLLLLAIHDAGDGIRASDLAEAFGVHKSTISRSVATLEGLGLVGRLADPADGRAQLVKASTKANRRINQIRGRGHQWLAGILSDWTTEEQVAFAANLARFNDAAEAHPY